MYVLFGSSRQLSVGPESTAALMWSGFVLNAEANVEVDLTALDALDQLREELSRRGITFAMARVKQDLRDAQVAAGLVTKIGEERIFMTLPAAVEAFRSDTVFEGRSWAATPGSGDC